MRTLAESTEYWREIEREYQVDEDRSMIEYDPEPKEKHTHPGDDLGSEYDDDEVYGPDD